MTKKIFWGSLLLFVIVWQSAKCNSGNLNDTTTTIKLGFVLPNGQQKMSIPFELNNNLIVIEVLLNNAIPLKFILDTGVRTTVLTEKTFTDLLNLKYSRKISIPGVGGEKLVDAYVTNNVTMKIGDMVGRGHALIVLEEDLLQLKNFLGSSVHGILGYELFSRFIIEVNYNTKTLTFYNPDYKKKWRRFKKYPIHIEDTKPYLSANYILRDSAQHTGKFMIDTGASHSFLIEKYSASNLYVPQPFIHSHLGRGLGGDLYGNIARIDEVSIPPFTFRDVIATFPDSITYDVDHSRTYRNGTIGGGMLSRFVVVFDYIHELLYLRKGMGFRKPFEYNLSGLVIKAKGLQLNKYEIIEVRKGSAAEMAGVKVGDTIHTVNGTSSKDLNLDQIIGLVNKKAGSYIKLVVIRDNKKVTLKFRLVRQV